MVKVELGIGRVRRRRNEPADRDRYRGDEGSLKFEITSNLDPDQAEIGFVVRRDKPA